jgi:hypothetical protein
MNNDLTLEKLRAMRLFGMHDAFMTSLENTLSFNDSLCDLSLATNGVNTDNIPFNIQE